MLSISYFQIVGLLLIQKSSLTKTQDLVQWLKACSVLQMRACEMSQVAARAVELCEIFRALPCMTYYPEWFF